MIHWWTSPCKRLKEFMWFPQLPSKLWKEQWRRTTLLWNHQFVKLYGFRDHFLDIKGIELLCEEKQVNIILSGIFVCYINTVSLFWHDLIFDRSHGSKLFDSDVVKASRFGEQAFERPCIRSGLAVLNSSMPCIVW